MHAFVWYMIEDFKVWKT